MRSSLPPSSTRPSSKPASVRSISSNVPIRGPRVEKTSSPARSRSTTSSARGTSMSSRNSQFAVMTGACVHAAWHSIRSREIVPSAVTSSWPTPSRSDSAVQIASPPSTAHIVLVHTPTW